MSVPAEPGSVWPPRRVCGGSWSLFSLSLEFPLLCPWSFCGLSALLKMPFSLTGKVSGKKQRKHQAEVQWVRI